MLINAVDTNPKVAGSISWITTRYRQIYTHAQTIMNLREGPTASDFWRKFLDVSVNGTFVTIEWIFRFSLISVHSEYLALSVSP